MIQSRHTRNKTTDIPTRIPATPAGTLLKNNNKKKNSGVPKLTRNVSLKG